MKRGLGALCGFAATVAFAVYNGALGAVCASPWHGSICAYYLLLSAARGLLLWGQRRERLSETDGAGLKRRYLCAAGGMILVMDLALAAPVILLVLDQRAASMGMIPAITSATYTTYKVTAAAVGLKRTPKDPFLRGLSALRFADALVSVLVLQNTLLLAVDGGITEDMLLLCLVSSAALFAVICVVTALWFAGAWKAAAQKETELAEKLASRRGSFYNEQNGRAEQEAHHAKSDLIHRSQPGRVYCGQQGKGRLAEWAGPRDGKHRYLFCFYPRHRHRCYGMENLPSSRDGIVSGRMGLCHTDKLHHHASGMSIYGDAQICARGPL